MLRCASASDEPYPFFFINFSITMRQFALINPYYKNVIVFSSFCLMYSAQCDSFYLFRRFATVLQLANEIEKFFRSAALFSSHLNQSVHVTNWVSFIRIKTPKQSRKIVLSNNLRKNQASRSSVLDTLFSQRKHLLNFFLIPEVFISKK